mgnify:CR=1 FL=1
MTVTPLRYVCTVNDETLPASTDSNYEFTYCDVTSVQTGHVKIPETTTTFSQAPSRARRIARPGDVVYATIRPNLKATALVPQVETPLIVSTAFAVLRPKEGLLPKYLAYAVQDGTFEHQLSRSAVGVSYPAIDEQTVKAARIPVPDMESQRRIVEFLDAELGRIDTLQTGLQRLADLVEERRLARLTSSFSSFDAAEKLKLKWILKKRSDEATPGSGTVTAFRDGQVTLRELRREDGYTFSETEDGYQSVHEGDLVFHGLDGFAGAIGIAEKDGNCSPVYHVCSLRNPDYDLTFIAEYLRYLGLAGYLATEAPNVRQRSVDFRNWDRFANLLLPFPRLEEQRRIIASLSADLEQDESFVQQVTQMQDLLKERRSALITAAVTGELEV